MLPTTQWQPHNHIKFDRHIVQTHTWYGGGGGCCCVCVCGRATWIPCSYGRKHTPVCCSMYLCRRWRPVRPCVRPPCSQESTHDDSVIICSLTTTQSRAWQQANAFGCYNGSQLLKYQGYNLEMIRVFEMLGNICSLNLYMTEFTSET